MHRMIEFERETMNKRGGDREKEWDREEEEEREREKEREL